MTLLEISGLTHRYPTTRGERPVLDQISLTVGENALVAVVGESGCGKTTLGRLAARLDRPESGTIAYRGRDIWTLRGKDLRAYRRSVQAVQQDPYASLNPGLTVHDVLAPGLLHHGLARRRNLTGEITRLLDLVGLDSTAGFLRRYPHQLSGGQRQRLAVARAISLKPSLVIADEAVSMLDVSMRVSILDLLLSLRRDEPLAYLFISHDLGVVRYFASGGRIVVMFYGVIVEQGPTEQVIASPHHPYTYLLLDAVPVPDPAIAMRRAGATLAAGTDKPPAASGCVFATRCPFADQHCRTTPPLLREFAPGQHVACHYPERVPDLTARTGAAT